MVSLDVHASNLFSGLVVSQSEQGVKIVDIYPGYPAERAGLRVGDIILEIDGQKLKSLEEFANISKTKGATNIEAGLLLIRKGALQNISLVNYSDAVFKEWKEKVPPPPESSIVGVSLFQYYLEKGKSKLKENQSEAPFEAHLANGQEAIKYFFYALHYNPTVVEVALLIADTYMNQAKLYLKNAQVPGAVENYSKAASLYERCSKRHLTEKELELILARLQEVEKELLRLLPSEEQGTVSVLTAPQPAKVPQ